MCFINGHKYCPPTHPCPHALLTLPDAHTQRTRHRSIQQTHIQRVFWVHCRSPNLSIYRSATEHISHWLVPHRTRGHEDILHRILGSKKYNEILDTTTTTDSGGQPHKKLLRIFLRTFKRSHLGLYRVNFVISP